MPLPQNQRRSNGVVLLVHPYRAKPLTKNLNTFKHNLKEHYLKKIKICNIPPFQFKYSFQIGVIPLFLSDPNVNTSNLMHVLCYPAISKSVISLSILTNITFCHSFVIIYIFNFNLVFNHFFVIIIFSVANTHLVTD